MGRFVKGQVVVVPFPFSDLTSTKRRPALVVAPLVGDDVILCQITTKNRLDGYSVSLTASDFVLGGLRHPSFIRPNHLFTTAGELIVRIEGTVTQQKLQEVIDKLTDIIRN